MLPDPPDRRTVALFKTVDPFPNGNVPGK
jgi:hypothetical protein